MSSPTTNGVYHSFDRGSYRENELKETASKTAAWREYFTEIGNQC